LSAPLMKYCALNRTNSEAFIGPQGQHTPFDA
jgi:hypothetical protein